MTGTQWPISPNWYIPRLKGYYNMWATCFDKKMRGVPLTEEEQRFVDTMPKPYDDEEG